MSRWGSEPTMIIEWAVRRADGSLVMFPNQEEANTFARHLQGETVHRSIAIDKWRTYQEVYDETVEPDPADVPWGSIAQEEGQ